MKKFLILAVLVILGISFSAIGFAQVGIESQPCKGKLKIEAYTEYINFNDSDLDASAWGGGILARYMFLDWLGAQTNFSLYGDCDTNKLGGDLSFSNWRLSVILHTYVPSMGEPLPLYVYGGAGLGYQFNSEVGNVNVDDSLTGHVLGGVGYDFHENFFIEAEAGYQFGNADVENYTDSKIGLEAVFLRMGVGVKF